jgi:hypothetical protein
MHVHGLGLKLVVVAFIPPLGHIEININFSMWYTQDLAAVQGHEDYP